jgi:tetratricopeptide (TPR) repeat protein
LWDKQLTNLPSLKGNNAYAAGDFERAISNYNLILNSGFESAELYLNLGNAYYKLRDYPVQF